MKVILYTLEGKEALEGVSTIREFEGGNVVFALDDETEYNTANDFPTMYRMEVLTEGE
jgi:hypothetical protein